MNKIFACRRLGANGRLRSTKHKRTCAFHNVVQHIYFLLGVHNESFHFKFQTGAIVNFMQSRIRNWFFLHILDDIVLLVDLERRTADNICLPSACKVICDSYWQLRATVCSNFYLNDILSI